MQDAEGRVSKEGDVTLKGDKILGLEKKSWRKVPVQRV